MRLAARTSAELDPLCLRPRVCARAEGPVRSPLLRSCILRVASNLRYKSSTVRHLPAMETGMWRVI